jgi:hypothetical protein
MSPIGTSRLVASAYDIDRKRSKADMVMVAQVPNGPLCTPLAVRPERGEYSRHFGVHPGNTDSLVHRLGTARVGRHPAIRNGDLHGNAGIERDATHQPIDNTPMHPKYPCAHCIVANAVTSVAEAVLGTTDMPEISMTSVTAPA